MDTKALIDSAGFDYVNALINEHNFPAPASVDITGWKLISTEGKVLGKEAHKLAKKGQYRHADVYELIEWKRLHGDDLEVPTWVLALGSIMKVGEKGKRRMPFVSLDSNGVFTISMGFYDSETRGSDEYLLCIPE